MLWDAQGSPLAVRMPHFSMSVQPFSATLAPRMRWWISTTSAPSLVEWVRNKPISLVGSGWHLGVGSGWIRCHVQYAAFKSQANDTIWACMGAVDPAMAGQVVSQTSLRTGQDLPGEHPHLTLGPRVIGCLFSTVMPFPQPRCNCFV